MQLDALRNRVLLALGLPLLGSGCATPGTPPSDRAAQTQNPPSEQSNQAASLSATPTANSKDAEPASVSIQTAASAVDPRTPSTTTTTATTPTPFSPCGMDQVREQLCGQGAHANPDSCPPTGEHLTAFGRNGIVSGINIHARDGTLGRFVFDPTATSAYRRELSGAVPQQSESQQCCYSHCQKLVVAASAPHQIPSGMTEGSYCIPMPEGGTKFPAAHARKCPAALQVEGVMRPYNPASVKGQCCYSIPVPMMPPHPRGRAARIDGVPQVADVVAASAWKTRKIQPQVEHLDPALRARLAARWLQDAQLEHASIAAFARTSLELLAFGAPPELVREAHQAALDEIAHARVAFALASAYAGIELGPQAFSVVKRIVPATDLATWARETIEDGCVGETIAAAEAHAGAQQSEDPVVRDVLLGIAADETRHAELAWKILRFALQSGGEEVAAVVRTVLATLVVEQPSRSKDQNADLIQHGILDEDASTRLRTEVMRTVVQPCLESLLQTQPWQASEIHVP